MAKLKSDQGKEEDVKSSEFDAVEEPPGG